MKLQVLLTHWSVLNLFLFLTRVIMQPASLFALKVGSLVSAWCDISVGREVFSNRLLYFK